MFTKITPRVYTVYELIVDLFTQGFLSNVIDVLLMLYTGFSSIAIQIKAWRSNYIVLIHRCINSLPLGDFIKILAK